MNLQQIAKELITRGAVSGTCGIDLQVVKLGEEAGEVAGAFCRWRGVARRPGTFDDLRHEIADVIIVASVLAERLNINVDDAVNEKLQIIYDRIQK